MYVRLPDGSIYAIGPRGPVHVTEKQWVAMMPRPAVLNLEAPEDLDAFRPVRLGKADELV